MIKIMFVCHGNICRSPMAEFVLKDMVKKQWLKDTFFCESLLKYILNKASYEKASSLI